MDFLQTDINYGIYPQSPGEGSSWEVGIGVTPGIGSMRGVEGIIAAQRVIDQIMEQYGVLPEGLPDWVYDVAGGLGQPGGPEMQEQEMGIPVTIVQRNENGEEIGRVAGVRIGTGDTSRVVTAEELIRINQERRGAGQAPILTSTPPFAPEIVDESGAAITNETGSTDSNADANADANTDANTDANNSNDSDMTNNNTTSTGTYSGTGQRPIYLPGGQVIYVPENLTGRELLVGGYISQEIYDLLSEGGGGAPDTTGSGSTITDTTGTGQVTGTTGTGQVTGTTTTGDVSTSLQGGDVSTSLQGGDVSTSLQGGDVSTSLQGGDVSTSLQGGDVSTSLQGGDVTTGDTSLTTGDTSLTTGDTSLTTGDTSFATGDTSLTTGDTSFTGGDVTTGDVNTDVTSQGGTGGSSSVVFNPYQPTLNPFELGEYGRLIPSTQSGVLPELADFMNYYGASVPGMTQQMANVTGAGQTAYAQQILGMDVAEPGDRISAFDIAREASRQQRGALGDVFGLGPDATYADITAAGTAPMQALTQTRETVLPGLQSAFQTAQERLDKGLTGRERQQVEQATRARFGALGRGADTAALATEIGDIMQEERGLYSQNLQDLLGIGQTTGALIGQEAYAMSPFTQAAIGAADLGPGLALAGDIGRQAAAATPSPTDLFGLEAGERQFGLDIDALEAAAEAGDLNVVSNMLSTIGSAFRGGPNAGLQQQPIYNTGTFTGQPLRYF